MDKIIEAFQGHIRVNETMGDIELFDEHGVKMRLKVDAETLAEFKKHYQVF